MLFGADGSGRPAQRGAESTVHVALVAKARRQRDFGERAIAAAEQEAGLLDPLAANGFVQPLAGRLAIGAGQPRRVEIEPPGEVDR